MSNPLVRHSLHTPASVVTYLLVTSTQKKDKKERSKRRGNLGASCCKFRLDHQTTAAGVGTTHVHYSKRVKVQPTQKLRVSGVEWDLAGPCLACVVSWLVSNRLCWGDQSHREIFLAWFLFFFPCRCHVVGMLMVGRGGEKKRKKDNKIELWGCTPRLVHTTLVGLCLPGGSCFMRSTHPLEILR